MKTWNMRSAWMWLGVAALTWAAGISPALAQDPSQGGGQASPPASPPAVIHIHHHFYAPLGVNNETGGDPAAQFNPRYYSYEESGFDLMPSANRNWGDLGLFAFLGEQSGNDGLIVSRVTPNSPAAKLGLVRGDVILQINDVEVGDLSFRQLQVLFERLSTTPKIKVTMQVWNVQTRRPSTLATEFVNEPVNLNPENE